MRNARRSGADSIRSRSHCHNSRRRHHRHDQNNPWPPDTMTTDPSGGGRLPLAVGRLCRLHRLHPHRRANGSGCCRMWGSTNPAAATAVAAQREDTSSTNTHSIKLVDCFNLNRRPCTDRRLFVFCLISFSVFGVVPVWLCSSNCSNHKQTY